MADKLSFGEKVFGFVVAFVIAIVVGLGAYFGWAGASRIARVVGRCFQ